MHRALTKILVSLALGLGLTLTSAAMVPAGAAPATPAATVAASAEPDCSSQQAALARAKDTHGKRVAAYKKARNEVRKAQRKLNKAKGAKAKKVRKAKVKKAKKVRAKADRRKDASRRAVATAQQRYDDCTSVPAGPTASPVQSLCDAGIPQPICDILASLIPSGSTASPIALLCSSVPQAQPLCDLLSAGGTPDPSTLFDVVGTLLDDLGLTELLNQLLGGLGLDSVLDPTGLDGLLDLLGLGGLLP